MARTESAIKKKISAFLNNLCALIIETMVMIPLGRSISVQNRICASSLFLREGPSNYRTTKDKQEVRYMIFVLIFVSILRVRKKLAESGLFFSF